MRLRNAEVNLSPDRVVTPTKASSRPPTSSTPQGKTPSRFLTFTPEEKKITKQLNFDEDTNEKIEKGDELNHRLRSSDSRLPQPPPAPDVPKSPTKSAETPLELRLPGRPRTKEPQEQQDKSDIPRRPRGRPKRSEAEINEMKERAKKEAEDVAEEAEEEKEPEDDVAPSSHSDDDEKEVFLCEPTSLLFVL